MNQKTRGLLNCCVKYTNWLFCQNLIVLRSEALQTALVKIQVFWDIQAVSVCDAATA